MKKTIAIGLLGLLFMFQPEKMSAQYGNTLNLGLGIGGHYGYFGYYGSTVPLFNVNYEIDVAKNFTIAPFAAFASFTRVRRINGVNYRFYETVIPVGAKAFYYFDELFNLRKDWDIYAGASLGFSIVRSRWDDNYPLNRDYFRGASPLFLDFHVGAQYNVNNKIGLFLDLSGISTFGVAIKMK